MPLVAIEGFRRWSAKRKGLLKGLLGLAVEGVAGIVPGGSLAVWSTRIVGEFAKHGVDRLADTSAAVPDVKPAGQSFPAEQLDQLNSWLASLSTSYAGLLDRLEALVSLPAEEPDEELPELVRRILSQHADLAREFDAHAEETRRQTLSLAHIEQRLDEIFHGQKGIALSLEEIKALILAGLSPKPDFPPNQPKETPTRKPMVQERKQEAQLPTIPDENLRPAEDINFNYLSSNPEVVSQLKQLHELVLSVCPNCLMMRRGDGALIYVPPKRQHAKSNKNLLTMWAEKAGVRMRIMYPKPSPEEEMYDPRSREVYLARLRGLFGDMG